MFNLLVAVCWLVFLVYWFVSAMGAKKNLPRKSIGKGIFIRIAVLFILIALAQIPALRNVYVAAFTSNLLANPLVGTIGVILCAAGVAFAIWARRNIGRNWGMPMSIKENPELVTAGPYAFVRHPIYTGVLAAIFGSALVSGAGWLLAFLGGCIYFIYSAKTEEKLMARQFPDTYPAYKKRTKMLIPFIW